MVILKREEIRLGRLVSYVEANYLRMEQLVIAVVDSQVNAASAVATHDRIDDWGVRKRILDHPEYHRIRLTNVPHKIHLNEDVRPKGIESHSHSIVDGGCVTLFLYGVRQTVAIAVK